MDINSGNHTVKINILLIEDNPDDIRLIQESFSQNINSRIVLEVAGRLEDSLLRLTKGGIDLVLLDLQLPDSSGIDTFIRVYTQAQSIPIIILTTPDTEMHAVKALKKGARDYIIKDSDSIDNSMMNRSIRHAIELIQAEKALHISARRYHLLAENVTDVVWTADLNLNWTYISPSVKRLLGYNIEEAMDITAEKLLTPTSLKVAREAIQEKKLKNNKKPGLVIKPLILELEQYRKDGSTVWTEAEITLLYNSNNIASGILGVTRDITAIKRSDGAILHTEKHYQMLLENISDLITIVDSDGIILYVSPSSERLLDYKPIDLIGENIFEFAHPDDKHSVVENFNKGIQRTDSLISIEFRFLKKSGLWSILETIGKPVIDNFGCVACVIVNSRDITARRHLEEEKRQLEDKLHRAEKMEALGTLAGGVAHDLNNVLSGIVSYPQLLLMDIQENNPMRKPLMAIQKSGRKAAAIVNDMLTLARRGVTITEVVNLNEILNDYIISPEHEKLKQYHPNVQYEINSNADLLNIYGSPVHLSKTIMNLISNATEALPDGGNVIISTKNQYINTPINGYDYIGEGEYVVLGVSDNGTGIQAKDLKRIFEPFFTKKVMGRSGTGLGLAVVWGTVKDHRGCIDVQSNINDGTTFNIYFPITREKIKTEQLNIKDSDSLKNIKGHGTILVVDDIKEQREIATMMLSRLGYSVSTASCGEEAVEYMKNKSVDLLVLDMIMDPGIDGLETYKKIIDINPGQKAVIISGYSETERVKQIQKLGAGTFIKKPFILEQIGMAIKTELRH